MKKRAHSQRSAQEVIDALHESGGIVSLAATRLGVTVQAIYKRMDTNAEIKLAQEEGEDLGDDLAEATLLRAMKSGRWADRIAAAKIRLSRAKSKRGYNIHKVGVGGIGKDGDVIPTEMTVSFTA